MRRLIAGRRAFSVGAGVRRRHNTGYTDHALFRDVDGLHATGDFMFDAGIRRHFSNDAIFDVDSVCARLMMPCRRHTAALSYWRDALSPRSRRGLRCY